MCGCGHTYVDIHKLLMTSASLPLTVIPSLNVCPQAVHNTRGAQQLLHLIKCVDRALTRLAQRNKGKKDVDAELKVRVRGRLPPCPFS